MEKSNKNKTITNPCFEHLEVGQKVPAEYLMSIITDSQRIQQNICSLCINDFVGDLIEGYLREGAEVHFTNIRNK
jgi:hypothetical protein